MKAVSFSVFRWEGNNYFPMVCPGVCTLWFYVTNIEHFTILCDVRFKSGFSFDVGPYNSFVLFSFGKIDVTLKQSHWKCVSKNIFDFSAIFSAFNKVELSQWDQWRLPLPCFLHSTCNSVQDIPGPLVPNCHDLINKLLIWFKNMAKI